MYGNIQSQILTEKWSILTTDKAQENCSHDSKCKCEWKERRKIDNSSQFEVLCEGKWVLTHNIVKKNFVSSPIGLIPVHGYAGKDNHSVDSMEWLYLLEKQLNSEGNCIQIQHAEVKKVKRLYVVMD